MGIVNDPLPNIYAAEGSNWVKGLGIVNYPLPNLYAAEGSNWVKDLDHNIFSHMGC